MCYLGSFSYCGTLFACKLYMLDSTKQMSSIVGDILYKYMIIWSEYLERDRRFLSSDPRLKYLQKYLVLLFYDKSFSCHWSSSKNVKYNRSMLIVPDTSLVWFLTYFQHVCWFVHNFCKLFSSFVWFWNEEGRRTMIVKFTVKISMMTETWNSFPMNETKRTFLLG